MLNPVQQFNRKVASSQVLSALIYVLEKHLPLHLQGTRITPADVFSILGYASVYQTSIETACQELESVPSGNRMREVLQAALPARQMLQSQLNRVFRAQLPPAMLKGKRAYALALDITLIPYHGEVTCDTPEVLRAQAKSGTKHFHGYATLSIVHDQQRYVLAIRVLQAHETMAEIVRDLLNRVRRLNIRVRRIYLDKEFYSIAVFKTLDRRGLAYIVPLPVRGRRKGVKALCQGRRSYFATHTLRSVCHGCYTVHVAVVRRNRRPHLKRSVRWFVYAVAGLPVGTTPQQVFELYRQRFGIETSYRQMHQVRARTSSRNARLRLLLTGLALILVNLYVALRKQFRSSFDTGQRRTWLSLRRLAFLLAHALERQLGLAELYGRQPLTVFS